MTATDTLPILLLLVTIQRLSELIIARRNTRRLLAAGGHEIGARHYPFVVAVHGFWLLALWAWWLTGRALLQPWAGVLYLLLQPLRIWTMCSLGAYWTTRIIVMSDTPLVRRGPYRFLRHPNYLVVIMEIALLPLALGSWQLAVLFSLANAAILRQRIAVEASSLRQRERNGQASLPAPV